MTVEVELPDGTVVEFPAGTDNATMEKALAGYAKQQKIAATGSVTDRLLSGATPPQPANRRATSAPGLAQLLGSAGLEGLADLPAVGTNASDLLQSEIQTYQRINPATGEATTVATSGSKRAAIAQNERAIRDEGFNRELARENRAKNPGAYIGTTLDRPERTWEQTAADAAAAWRDGARTGVTGLIDTPRLGINALNAGVNAVAGDINALLGAAPGPGIGMLDKFEWQKKLEADADALAKHERQMTGSPTLEYDEENRPDDFAGAVGYMASNPGSLIPDAARTAGTMMSSIVPGSGGGTIAAQASQQAAMASDDVYDSLIAKGVAPDEARREAAKAFAPGLAVGLVAPRLVPGGRAIEDMLSGTLGRGTGGMLGRVAMPFIGEMPSEAGEEGAIQAIQNVYSRDPVGQGVGGASALGGALGGGMATGPASVEGVRALTEGQAGRDRHTLTNPRASQEDRLAAAMRLMVKGYSFNEPAEPAARRNEIAPDLLQGMGRSEPAAPPSAQPAPPASPAAPTAPTPSEAEIDAMLVRNVLPEDLADELGIAPDATVADVRQQVGALFGGDAPTTIDTDRVAAAMGDLAPAEESMTLVDFMRAMREEPTTESAPAAPPAATATPASQSQPAQTLSDASTTMQNRDRSRPASVAQMQGIRKNPDPQRLGFSRDPNTGAPMIGEGMPVPEADVGRTDSVVMQQTGRTVPVRYAVVEASQLAASHDADGRVNPDYESASLKALNNGRVAGLQGAWKDGNANAYREGIAADAGLHGVSAEAIASKREPVLVRLYDPALNTGDMGAESNASAQLGLSPVEQAQTDARGLPDLAGVTWAEDGTINPASNANFFRAWFKNMGDAQAASLQDAQGRPNASALQRVRAAMVQKAYGDDRLLTALVEDTDPDNRNVMNALVQAAPAFATLEDGNAVGKEIRDALVGGLEMLRDASARGVSLSDALAQADMFGRNADADTMAGYMAANARSAKRMAEAFKLMAEYAARAEQQAATMDVFGNAPQPTVGAAIESAGIEGRSNETVQRDEGAARGDRSGEYREQAPRREAAGDSGAERSGGGVVGGKAQERSLAAALAEQLPKKTFQDGGAEVTVAIAKGKSANATSDKGFRVITSRKVGTISTPLRTIGRYDTMAEAQSAFDAEGSAVTDGSGIAEEGAGLFGRPTATDVIGAAQRRKDGERDGRTGTGRTDMAAGDGELFAGRRPEQGDIETGTLPATDVSKFGATRPLTLAQQAAGPSASERSSRAPQFDLFVATRGQAEPAAGNPPVVKVDRPKLAQSVKMVQTGQFRSGVERVEILADAAHILAPLRKSPQERFMVLALDADNRPLAILQHTVGGIAESQVFNGMVFGGIASIPGVKSVVFGHNHPSGNPKASPADLTLDQRLTKLFDGSGIQVRGAIILTPGSRSFTVYSELGKIDYSSTRDPSTPDVVAARRTGTVKIVEPMLRKVKPNEGGEGLQITSPKIAEDVVREERQKNPAGIVLLDNQNGILGVVPFDPSQTEKLRTGDIETSHASWISIATGANAAAAIVYGDKAGTKGIANMARAMAAGDLRVLDVFEFDGNRTVPQAAQGRQWNGDALESVESLADDGDYQVRELSESDLTESEREARDRLTGKQSRDQGKADAERMGLRAAVEEALGPVAEKVEYLRGIEGLPARLRDGVKARMEQRNNVGRTAALYDPATKNVYLFTDVVKSADRAVWNAAHEIAGHEGLRTLLGPKLDAALTIALQNPTVKALADKIAEQRKLRPGQSMLAAEEALAELSAAIRTGNFDEIETRYGVKVAPTMRERVKKAIENFLARMKRLIDAKYGEGTFSDADVRALLEAAWQAVGVDPTVTVLAKDGTSALEQVVFHGTPHKVDRFSLQKIGTGEGNQVYGWGLYFASKREIAESYRKKLTPVLSMPGGVAAEAALKEADGNRAEAIRRLKRRGNDAAVEFIRRDVNRGNTYQVEVPENSDLLNWDRPLNRQPEKVRAAIQSIIDSGALDGDAMAEWEASRDKTGKRFYTILQQSDNVDGARGASEALMEAGVPGLRYADGESRSLTQADVRLMDALDANPGDREAALDDAMRGIYASEKEKAAIRRTFDGRIDSLQSQSNYVIWDEAAIGTPEALENVEPDQTETPAFKRWFGDSKVVDEAGKPLVVYHGTDAEFDAFDPDRSIGGQYWFTTDLAAIEAGEVGAAGSGRVVQAFLSIKNPAGWAEYDALTLDQLIQRGYDGLALPDGDSTVYVAFNPEQIKSATGNRGTFDPASDSILESVAYTPEQEEFMGKAGVGTDTRTAWGKIRDWVSAKKPDIGAAEMLQATTDGYYGLKRATAAAGGISVENDPYVATRMVNIASTMEAILRFGGPKMVNGALTVDRSTTGLYDALRPVYDNLPGFFGWMVARRAKLLKAQGRENLMSDADIAAGLSLRDGNEAAFDQAAASYLKLKNSILDFAEQHGGTIDPVARAAWDHAEYIPFYREGDAKGPGTRGGIANQAAGIKRLRGGEQAIRDPLSNIVQNFTRMMDSALKNRAMLLAVDQLGAPYFEKVPMKMGQATIPLDQVKAHLLATGVDQAAIDAMPASAIKGVGRMMSIEAPTDDDVVRVMRNGKAEYHRVLDPLVLRSITSMQEHFTDELWMLPLKWTKTLLTAGATATVGFMVRNGFRDTAEAAITAREHFIPVWDTMRGAIESVRETEFAQDLMMAGSYFHGGLFHQGDFEATSRATKRALRKHGMSDSKAEKFAKTLINPKAWWDTYRTAQEATEMGSRVSLARNRMAATGNFLEAAFEAKDFLDFQLKGDAKMMQRMIQVLPFLNARMQGNYRVGRAALTMKDRRRIVLARLAMVAVNTAMLYAWNMLMYRDEYDELPEWEKDLYWHIAPNTPRHVRIPKPFELGLIAGTGVERGMAAIVHQFSDGKDGDRSEQSWAALLRGLMDTLALNPVPQGVKPGLEVFFNYDTFGGRKIESDYERRKAPADRKGPRTSTIAIQASKGMEAIMDDKGLSPKQIEHLWRGYTAGTGMWLLGMADRVVENLSGAPERPASSSRDWPGIGAIYRGDGVNYSTRYSDEFYSLRDEADKRQAAIKASLEEGNTARAERIEKEYRWLLGQRIGSKQAKGGFSYTGPREIARLGRVISKMRKADADVYASRSMTPAQKRETLEANAKERNDMMMKAVRQYREAERKHKRSKPSP